MLISVFIYSVFILTFVIVVSLPKATFVQLIQKSVKIRLTKQFPFEMAHALYGYDGPCKNIHGHSYRLEVTLIGEPRDNPEDVKNGMVMDFTDLKKIVKTNIVDVFDHALVLNGNSPHRNIPDLNEHFEKVIFVSYQPTCENLLTDFLQRILPLFPSNVNLQVIRLHETATSYAEWRAEDN